MLKLTLFALIFCSSLSHAGLGEDKAKIDSDCQADAVTAGCKGKKMDQGLGKCLFAAKQKNAKFQLTPKCQADMTAFRKDKNAYWSGKGPGKGGGTGAAQAKAKGAVANTPAAPAKAATPAQLAPTASPAK